MSTIARVTMISLLATALGLTACGIKGDPITPGSKDDPKTQSTG